MDSNTEPAHAPISPSSIHRVINCMASLIPLEHPVPERPNAYAAEGDRFHELIANASRYGATMLAGEEDAEMRDHAYELVKHRRAVREKIGEKAIFKELIEQRVRFSDYIWGTDDYAILYVKDGEKRIYIDDAKYGRGKPVPVTMEIDGVLRLNPQLATYLSAIRRNEDWPAVRATAAIYQPRCTIYHEKALEQHVVEAAEMDAWDKRLTKLEPKALRVMNGQDTPTPNVGEWCQFCKRIPVCPAYSKAASADGLLALASADPLPISTELVRATLKVNKVKEPAELTDEQISNVLEYADMIRSFLKAVETYAAGRAVSGHPLEGWKVVEGRKTRRWIQDSSAVITSLRALGVDPERTTIAGITEVTKLLSEARSRATVKKLLEPLTTYTTPKPKLVRVTDPRPELTADNLSLLDMLPNDEVDNDGAEE